MLKNTRTYAVIGLSGRAIDLENSNGVQFCSSTGRRSSTGERCLLWTIRAMKISASGATVVALVDMLDLLRGVRVARWVDPI